jgi:hypothetical protein
MATAGARRGWADEPAKASPPAKPVQLAGRSLSADDTAGWIQQLGDDRFSLREEASAHLSRLGIEIRPTLETALRNPDPEIRVRVRRILEAIVKDDLVRRLSAFADDVNDAKHYDLPGWSRYRQVVGSGPAARRLFIEMQRSEPELFMAVGDSPAATAQSLGNRIIQQSVQLQIPMRSRIPAGNTITMGSISAMLFVGSDKHVAIADDLGAQLVYLTNSAAANRQSVAGGNASAEFQKILGAWVSRDASGNLLYLNLNLAIRYDLKEGIGPAAAALRQPNQASQVKQIALMLIGKLGDKANLPAVESCLKDGDVCGAWMMNNRQPFQTQVRDVALAVDIKLQGQDPKAFGFDRFDTNGFAYYNPSIFGFRSAADRESAAKKWEAWLAAHRGTADASTQTKRS